MKVYNEQNNKQLCSDIQSTLQKIRVNRNFLAEDYVTAKGQKLNEYMKKSGLSACVVAISGGIDSAVVLGLVDYASKLQGSPIKKIVPILLPIQERAATTNQADALSRGVELCNTYSLQPGIADLTSAFKALKQVVNQANKVEGNNWASGQLVAYIRTPAIYYTTSLLSQQNTPAIVCGTTNLDEGGYLGYFGKASDGMVDVQLISDIHKSEVFELAKYLNIPQSILEVVPNGDMYDGRVDEEVFGAPYDFVELYMNYLNLTDIGREGMQKNWTKEAKSQFKVLAGRLENLHNYNSHKYLAKSPAVHLDILESKIKGGWNNEKH